MGQPVLEQNEGARRANDKIWQHGVEQELVAIRKLLEKIMGILSMPRKS